MDLQLQIIWNILSALGIGLLIGIERGWSGREEDEGDRVAGIRTFSLVGLLGGVWGELSRFAGEWMVAVIFLSLTALVITSYIIDTREDHDLGITTEIALLLTFSLGAWSTLGYQLYALAVTVIVISLLSLKPVLHRWLQEIEVKEIYAGIKLLVISVILLPLLPNEGFGPWQSLNPYWIWWMVVLISGLSFTGYILIKYLGRRHGTLLTAVTGGLASSTAVTLSLAQLARQQKQVPSYLFMAGVLVASSIMFVRVAIEVLIVNPSLWHPLWVPLTVMMGSTGIAAIWLWRKSRNPADKQPEIDLKNPLQFFTALQFGLLLAVILVFATAMEHWYGDEGIYLLALLSGLMDVDAITLSLSRMALNEIGSDVAVSGIVISVISNTLVKGALFTFWTGFNKSKTLLWLILLISAIGVLSILPFL